MNSAIYARPDVIDEQTVAFVSAGHRTLANLRENFSASYLFRAEGPGSSGVRLTLKLTGEERDPARVDELRRREQPTTHDRYQGLELSWLTFEVLQRRPLIGTGSAD